MSAGAAASRLVLGTAQFGLPYGISNAQGQIPLDEGTAILSQAHRAGVTTLDTAVAYGESEQVLGELGISSWKVITKLPPLPERQEDISGWVATQLNESLKRLRSPFLHGLLLHRPTQLATSEGPALYRALREQQEIGRVHKIGISIYDPSELESLGPEMKFDIVQAPTNVLDNRIHSSGWSSRLKDMGCELHARSVFLQGLLLFPTADRPVQFRPWNSLWKKWDSWLAETGLTPLQACLRHALSSLDIDKLVIGVNSQQHLIEIIDAMKGELPPLPADFSTDDIKLLNPALWPKP